MPPGIANRMIEPCLPSAARLKRQGSAETRKLAAHQSCERKCNFFLKALALRLEKYASKLLSEEQRALRLLFFLFLFELNNDENRGANFKEPSRTSLSEQSFSSFDHHCKSCCLTIAIQPSSVRVAARSNSSSYCS